MATATENITENQIFNAITQMAAAKRRKFVKRIYHTFSKSQTQELDENGFTPEEARYFSEAIRQGEKDIAEGRFTRITSREELHQFLETL